jgi:hypothetical protein
LQAIDPLEETLASLGRNAKDRHIRPDCVDVGLRSVPAEFDGVGQVGFGNHGEIRRIEDGRIL